MTNKQMMYICPKCGEIDSSKSENATCSFCDSKMLITDLSYDKWLHMRKLETDNNDQSLSFWKENELEKVKKLKSFSPYDYEERLRREDKERYEASRLEYNMASKQLEESLKMVCPRCGGMDFRYSFKKEWSKVRPVAYCTKCGTMWYNKKKRWF